MEQMQLYVSYYLVSPIKKSFLLKVYKIAPDADLLIMYYKMYTNHPDDGT